LDYKAQLIQR